MLSIKHILVNVNVTKLNCECIICFSILYSCSNNKIESQMKDEIARHWKKSRVQWWKPHLVLFLICFHLQIYYFQSNKVVLNTVRILLFFVLTTLEDLWLPLNFSTTSQKNFNSCSKIRKEVEVFQSIAFFCSNEQKRVNWSFKFTFSFLKLNYCS